jgi:hypothetical protein
LRGLSRETQSFTRTNRVAAPPLYAEILA